MARLTAAADAHIARAQVEVEGRLAADGEHDRLMEFTRGVSGAYYFAPSQNVLRQLAGPELD